MRRRNYFSRLALTLALAACGRERSQPPPASSGGTVLTATPLAAAVPQQDTGFRGTKGVTDRRRPRATPAILRAVTAVSFPGYDRIVFEFAGDSLPGYHVEYAARPVVRCGSGDPVTVAGQGRLLIRLEPARAHDEQGRATIAQRASAPGLPAIQELKLVCDFEGQVEWVVGVVTTPPYRVSEASGPPRLSLDVQHAP